MKKIILYTFTIISIVIITNGCSEVQSNTDAEKKQKNMTSKSKSLLADDLKAAMRQLWEEHITWTRNVIICLVDDAPGIDQAEARLLKNQVDIGNAIKPYYGEEAGKKFTDLLYPHIKFFAEVVKAKRRGNTAAFDDANKRGYANADDISAYFNKANPNWKLADMQLMMNTHLKLTTEEAVARIKKDYDADVKAFDAAHIEILKMADLLSGGIVLQYPEKFIGSAAIGKTK